MSWISEFVVVCVVCIHVTGLALRALTLRYHLVKFADVALLVDAHHLEEVQFHLCEFPAQLSRETVAMLFQLLLRDVLRL